MIEIDEGQPEDRGLSSEEIDAKRRRDFEAERAAKAPLPTLPSARLLLGAIGLPIHIRRLERPSRYSQSYYGYLDEGDFGDFDFDDEEGYREPIEAASTPVDPEPIVHEHIGFLHGVRSNPDHRPDVKGSVLYTLSLKDGEQVSVSHGDTLTVRGFKGTGNNQSTKVVELGAYDYSEINLRWPA